MTAPAVLEYVLLALQLRYASSAVLEAKVRSPWLDPHSVVTSSVEVSILLLRPVATTPRAVSNVELREFRKPPMLRV